MDTSGCCKSATTHYTPQAPINDICQHLFKINFPRLKSQKTVLADLSKRPCPVGPVLTAPPPTVLSWQSRSACSVLTVPFWLSRFDCPLLAILIWLSHQAVLPFCSACCLILAVLCWQPCRVSPVLGVLPWMSYYAVLFCLFISACPILAVLSWQSCADSPDQAVLSTATLIHFCPYIVSLTLYAQHSLNPSLTLDQLGAQMEALILSRP